MPGWPGTRSSSSSGEKVPLFALDVSPQQGLQAEQVTAGLRVLVARRMTAQERLVGAEPCRHLPDLLVIKSRRPRRPRRGRSGIDLWIQPCLLPSDVRLERGVTAGSFQLVRSWSRPERWRSRLISHHSMGRRARYGSPQPTPRFTSHTRLDSGGRYGRQDREFDPR